MNFWRKNKFIYRTFVTIFVFLVSFIIFSQLAIAADAPFADKLTKDSNAFAGGTCAGWTGVDIGACILTAISWILSWIQWVFLFVLQIAVWFFEFSVDQSINSLSTYMSDSGGLVMVWKLLRDITNMLFLMIMLYIAIGTVLQLEGVNWKKQIGAIIMAAVLINFSMTIAKVIVDASNVFAIYFYEQASGGPDGPGVPRLLFNAVNVDQIVAHQSSVTGVPSALSLIIQTLASIVLILATSYVLFLAGFLFIVRLISIIFSLIMSPLPWIGMAVPKFGGEIGGNYWKTLINQSLFAPIFMFCLYFVMRFITCVDVNAIAGSTGGGYLFAGTIPSLMFYAVAISLMFSTVIVAKKLGAEGMSFAQSGAKWAMGTAIGAGAAVAAYGGKRIGGGISALDQRLGGYGAAGAGRISGAITGAADIMNKTELGKAVTTKVGMTYEAAKEKAKSPLATASDLVKAGTGVEILPGVAGIKEREKAEKEYKRKKEVDDAITLINSYAGKNIADTDTQTLDKIKTAWKKVTKERAMEIDRNIWTTTAPTSGNSIAAQWATKDIYETWNKESKDSTSGITKAQIESMEAALNSNRRNREAKVAVEGKVAKRDIKADLAATGGTNVMNIIKGFMGKKSIHELGADILNDPKVYKQFDIPRLNALLSAPDDVVSMDDLKNIKADILSTTTDIDIKDHLNKDKRWKEF